MIMAFLHKEEAVELISFSSLDMFNLFITEKRNHIICLSLDLSMVVFRTGCFGL